jgi:hypothetical protein
MTLCVAAHCYEWKESKHKVVFAADLEMEGPTARAAIAQKARFVGPHNFPVLLAGTTTRAIDLANTIDRVLRRDEKPRGSLVPFAENQSVPYKELLEEAVLAQKRKIAAEMVAGAFGIGYQDFLDKGKETLPDDVYREMVYEINRTTLGCSLLVVAYNEFTPHIFRIGETGLVETCESFAAIGSGSYIAESTLFQREHHEHTKLGKGIYNVYEAMKLGGHAPGVSSEFEIYIAEWDYFRERKVAGYEGSVAFKVIGEKYQEYLLKLFKRYGPKPFDTAALKRNLIEGPGIELTQRGHYFSPNATLPEPEEQPD